MHKSVITCAITGAVTSLENTPHLPITPQQIAESALDAAKAGAAIVHIHVRDPITAKPSMNVEHYREVVDRIKSQNEDVLINLTTGPGASGPVAQLKPGADKFFLKSAQKRAEHIAALKPDICSLDLNTMNRGPGGVTLNTLNTCREIATIVKEAGVKPELEIFDSGDLDIAKQLISEGLIEDPPLWQFAMGIKWGWVASAETLDYARRLLPHGHVWSAFGIGRMEMPIVAQSWIYGGHTRVGLEDNVFLSKGVLAKSNAELVEKATRIIRDLGGDIATPQEARELYSIKKKGT